MRIHDTTILVIGATSGIGRALATQLTARGARVLAGGRDRDALASLRDDLGIAGERVDVADAESVLAFRDAMLRAHGPIDAVVVAAGIMQAERIREPGALDVAERTVATNLLGTIRVVDAFLPHLLERPDATIVTVTSGLAFVPLALTPTYSATKAGVHAYTEAIRAQLRDTAVQVVEIAPPLTRTQLMRGGTDIDAAMPVDAFVAECLARIEADPGIAEVLVDRVRPQRFAIAEGTYDALFERQAERR